MNQRPTPRLALKTLAEEFGRLVDLAEPERAAWFNAAELHPEDERLLMRMLSEDARPASGFLDQSATQLVQALGDEDPTVSPETMIGRRFGAFEVTRLIGQGGMASVFEGRRVGGDFEQAVAIKVLKRGLFSSVEQRLFRRERQLLAQLSHTNIAHLIDGGIAEPGIPYLVLELIDGEPIDQYAASRLLGLRQRVELFLAACRGVEAANRALIVHRDLKPANILVTRDGVPKLLDFGIAALLQDGNTDGNSSTLTAGLTPGYASPEQLNRGRVTTATDVYALGIVLHELITGIRPQPGSRSYPLTPPTAASLSRAGVNQSSARVRSVLKADLGRIIEKATEDLVEDRYPSASALIEDVERWLGGEPVRAHPHSTFYRLSKFTRRNLPVVMTALVFSVGLIGMTGYALHHAAVASAESKRATMVRDFIVRLFQTADATEVAAARPTPSAVVMQGLDELRADTEMDDLLRADLLAVLTRVQMSIGDNKELDADALTKELLGLAEQRFLPGTPIWIESRALRAQYLMRHERSEEARALLDPIEDILRANCSPASLSARLDAVLAHAKVSGRDTSDIAARYADIQQWALGCALPSRSVFAALVAEVNFTSGTHKFAAALDLSRRAWAYHRRHELPESAVLVWLLTSMGNAASSLNDPKEGEKWYREAIRIAESLTDAPTREKAYAIGLFGSFLVSLGRLDEAGPYLEEALSMRITLFGPSHEDVVFARNAIGRAHMLAGDAERAVTALDPGVKECSNNKNQSNACVRALSTRARAWLMLGDIEKAEQDIDVALAAQLALDKSPNSMMGPQLVVKTEIQRLKGEPLVAIETAERTQALYAAAGGGYWADVATLELQRIWSLADAGRIDDANRALALYTEGWQRSAQKSDRLQYLLEVVSAAVAAARMDHVRAATHASEALRLADRPVGADQHSLAMLRELRSRHSSALD